MDTKEDEEHVGHHLEEMLKNELNVSIQITNLMIKEVNVHFLFLELINFLVKLIANITTKKMGEVVISVRRSIGIICNFYQEGLPLYIFMTTLCVKCFVCQTEIIQF